MISVRRRWSCLVPAFLLGLVFLLGGAVPARGFTFNGYTWAPGTQIELHLGPLRPPVALQYGSGSWTESATDALNIWNQYVDSVKLVAAPSASVKGDDGVSSVFFSDAIYGEAWPTGVLAVTLYYSDAGNGAFSETD